jgi:hypothetical protein
MRRVLMAAAAAAMIGIATPASATITLSSYNGPDLSTAVKASTTNSANDTSQVYGCTQNNGACANVQFTGLQSDQITTEAIHITDGAGFAAISDSPSAGTGNFYSLIIDPTPDFNQYMFSIALADDGIVSVYYMLSGGSGWTLATPTGGIAQNANANKTYLVQGDVMTAIMVSVSCQQGVTSCPITLFKQNSITLGSVPAPLPEPATWAMMLLGFGGMGMALRRSRRRGKQALMQIA